MIKKITTNPTTEPLPITEPLNLIKEKLDYYRSLFGGISLLSEEELDKLKADIKDFFTLKPAQYTDTLPEHLFRISINNRILESQGLALGFLTEINQILAPPKDVVGYNRCNLPREQVLYCATDEAAYWETKPKRGDVITISVFKKKDGAKANCVVLPQKYKPSREVSHELMDVFNLLQEFFIEVFTKEISRDTPKEYLFSATLSSSFLFYPIPSEDNVEAIIYPSIQKKLQGRNIALKNELIFEKYNILEITTRFVIGELDGLHWSSKRPTTENLLPSFSFKSLDFNSGKISDVTEEAKSIFPKIREIQMLSGKQTIFKQPIAISDISDLAALYKSRNPRNKSLPQNKRVTVTYMDGTKKEKRKFKTIVEDVRLGHCVITKVH